MRQDPGASGDCTDELVVWDWKSGDAAAASYIEEAKADFAKEHPRRHRRVRCPAAPSSTTPCSARPGGRARTARLLRQDRLTGWDAFSRDGKIYASPVTLQGHPIYYNEKLYEQAGLDPDSPPTTWQGFVSDCETIMAKTGTRCLVLGNFFWAAGR